VALYYPASAGAILLLLGFVLLLTPTGSLPSPRWRWWARAMVAVPVAMLLVVTLAPGTVDPYQQVIGGPFEFHGLGGVPRVVEQLALALTTLTVVIGAGSLVLRFRRARGVERQQLRWVALAAALLVPAAVAEVIERVTGVAHHPGHVWRLLRQLKWSPQRPSPTSVVCYRGGAGSAPLS
jgi:Winged helix-turn helix